MSKWGYAGLFMVTLATLMYEILLTRIFSVTMWYHFAFMAISVAMFGMTLGALRVYLRRETFAAGPVKYQLALSALLFGISAVVSFVVHMVIPFVPEFSLLSMGLLAVIYVVLTVPFV